MSEEGGLKWIHLEYILTKIEEEKRLLQIEREKLETEKEDLRNARSQLQEDQRQARRALRMLSRDINNISTKYLTHEN